MRSTFSVLFYLKRKDVRSNGQVPVMARITVDGTKASFSCKLLVDPGQWDTAAGKLKGKSDEVKKMNLYLQDIWKSCKQQYDEMIDKDNYANAEKIKNAYLGLDMKCNTLLQVLKRHNDEFAQMVEAESRSKSTLIKYISVYNHLQDFMKYKYNRSDLALKEIQPAFITDFDLYLRTQKRCCNNTVWVYMMPLRMCIETAINNGWLSRDPFFEYGVAPEETDREHLSLEEIKAIMDYQPKRRMEELVRDLFIFCCFTGYCFTDLRSLKKNNLEVDINNKWLIKRRNKSNVSANVRLLDIPQMILNKYDGTGKGDRLLPVPAYLTLLKHLSNITNDCGITRHITWHAARHSFATDVCLNNGVPMESVSKMLGHKYLSTTQIYAKITNQKVGQDMDVLEQRLNNIDLFHARTDHLNISKVAV